MHIGTAVTSHKSLCRKTPKRTVEWMIHGKGFPQAQVVRRWGGLQLQQKAMTRQKKLNYVEHAHAYELALLKARKMTPLSGNVNTFLQNNRELLVNVMFTDLLSIWHNEQLIYLIMGIKCITPGLHLCQHKLWTKSAVPITNPRYLCLSLQHQLMYHQKSGHQM